MIIMVKFREVIYVIQIALVSQFNTYEYDQRGNMIKEEYFSCL